MRVKQTWQIPHMRQLFLDTPSYSVQDQGDRICSEERRQCVQQVKQTTTILQTHLNDWFWFTSLPTMHVGCWKEVESANIELQISLTCCKTTEQTTTVVPIFSCLQKKCKLGCITSHNLFHQDPDPFKESFSPSLLVTCYNIINLHKRQSPCFILESTTESMMFFRTATFEQHS